MTGILDSLRHTAKTQARRILLPEHYDERVIAAATALAERQLAVPVLIDLPDEINEAPAGVEVFRQRSDAAEWTNKAIAAFTEARAAKGMTAEKATEQLKNPVLLAAVLLKLGFADGGVAGSTATTADVLRAGIQGLGLAQGAKQVSSFFLMELTDGRVLTYGDCGVIPDPDSAALAEIAVASAASHQRLTGEEAKVAMLSFSTKGSAEHPRVDKVRAALDLAKQAAPALAIDGELQFDAAFVPAIGEKKAPGSAVAGHANVFIFPDLDSGNIGYKITQRIGGAKALGPLLQGLAKPWMDLSRGCSAEDIVDVAVIAGVLG
ncbi:phosphate acetyltransferase [Spongiibacter taiwanensis]|uniref:phosphate acetyltransferase n=1 Tax=Spongiibacter taiwanensis TaxID=1748242 RepID=UPI002034BEEB|nr:phosphate acetyltransferase [Spongiibacter taiwanensis]USA44569.1 phosphate acetyltransferase [Spongiibacter taiwanensis]